VTLLNRLFVLVAVALAPSIIVLIYNQFELYETQLKATDSEILQTAVQVAAEQEQATEAVRQLLVAVSTIPRAATGDTKTEFGQLACAFNDLAQTVHVELANREQTERLLTERNSEIVQRSAMLEAQTTLLLCSLPWRIACRDARLKRSSQTWCAALRRRSCLECRELSIS
jgi:hypothetical protein